MRPDYTVLLWLLAIYAAAELGDWLGRRWESWTYRRHRHKQ